MILQEFIRIVETVPLYYQGNSYKETLNYCLTDNINALKRYVNITIDYSNINRVKYLINEILYNLSILNPEVLEGFKNKKIVF